MVVHRNKWSGGWRGRSYFRSTVGKALGNAARHRRDRREGAFYAAAPEEQKHEGVAGAGHVPPEDSPETRRQMLLDELNRAVIFGKRLHFTNVIRSGSCYLVYDDNGNEIRLGTAREMNAFYVTQANIAEATGVNLFIPSGKKATYWFPAVELIIRIAQLQRPKFEAGLEVETREYLVRGLNFLTADVFCNAAPVDLNSSEDLFFVNCSIRRGRRDDFLHRFDPAQGKPEDKHLPLPRFIFWSTDRRFCVQVPMLQMFLSTPVGGNERIPADTDRLKQGLAALGFTLDVVKTGQFGKQKEKVSVRWAISPQGFELEPGCDPQPGFQPDDRH